MKEVIMRVASFSADYPKAPIYVADLVRCKECKYWANNEMQFDNNLVVAPCKQWLQYTRMNGYCHNGERKESE